LKKLHDLLVLRIIQQDTEKKTFPLAQIVGRAGIKWDTEFPVDKGWVDIYVPVQKGIEHPYAIEVQTGYDFNCAGILQQLKRFESAIPKKHNHEIFATVGNGLAIASSPIQPKLCVVIPKDFAEFVPLFKPKGISVFLWEGTLEWECKKCKETTLSSGPWKPMTCNSSLCKDKERSFRLIGLANFEITQSD
jgi:hypothetical protein